MCYTNKAIAVALAVSGGLCWGVASVALSDDEPAQLEEVVVTAQKRAQAAQDVPISLVAISGASLENSRISGMEDLSQVVAGLEIVGGTPGQDQISLRGVTNLSGGIESTAAIGYYVDEVPVSSFSNEMPEMALWDLERVEILRGPQGTLFGEGSMAGTIRIITNKPDPNDFAARVEAEGYGTDGGAGSYDARGLVNIPVISNTLGLRISASYKDDGGWNNVPDLHLTDVNTNRQSDARIAARWLPLDGLTVDASFAYHQLDTGDAFRATSPGVFDPRQENPAVGPVGSLDPVDTKFETSNLTASYDFGKATLVSASSFFHQNIDYTFDYDPYVGYLFGPDGQNGTLSQSEQARIFTQEIRLVSDGHHTLDWTVGGFYSHSDRHILQGFDFGVIDLLGPGTGLYEDHEASSENATDTAWAAFAQGDYEFARHLSMQFGLRYYEDSRYHTYETLLNSIIFGETAGAVTSGSGGETAITPKWGLSWKPTDSFLTYVSVSRGFRGGGTNANASLSTPSAPIPSDFKGEFLWSYELGMKSSPWRNSTLNAYVYYNDWTELQLVFVTPNGLYAYTSNAGSARSIGSELEFSYALSERLTARASASYIDALITQTVSDPNEGVLAQEGNRIPFSPKWKASLAADYRLPLTSEFEGVFHGVYSYRTSYFSDAPNTAQLENPGYGQLNLSAGVERHRWSADLFANNVTNSQRSTYRTWAVEAADVVDYTFQRPRTVGIRVRASF